MTADEIMAAVYEAYALRDLDGALSAFAEEARYIHYPPDLEMPFAGEFVGVEAIRTRILNLADLFEYVRFDVLDSVATEDKVASRVRTRVRNKQTGVELDVDLAHFAYFRGSQIVEFHEYADSSIVKELSRTADGLLPD